MIGKLILLATVAALSACASSPAAYKSAGYDQQFCTLKVQDAQKRERCAAWSIGPSREQTARFERRR